jgi:hypothetical protein
MNKLLVLAVGTILCAALIEVRAERFDAAAWAKVKTYDVVEIENLDRLLPGEIVGVRFHYRHRRISHRKPNWYQGSLWTYNAGEKKKLSSVPVMVAKESLPAFEAIATAFKSGNSYLAYGVVLQDSERLHFRFLRLIGTKVERDTAGNATVGW